MARKLPSSRRGALLVLAATLMLAALVSPPARASLGLDSLEGLEFVKAFGQGAEGEGELASDGVLAVNDATHDVYEADANHARVLRFDSEGRFLEAWGWGVADGKTEFERCGPDGEPAYPVCEGDKKEGGGPGGQEGEGPGEFNGAEAVAIDQTTGDVFVESSHQTGDIQVFSPTGQLIASFGELGSAGSRQIGHAEGLAVGSSGEVYLVDTGEAHGPRVMVFRPNLAGEYTYTEEFFHGLFYRARYLFLDLRGAFYLADTEQIEEFASPSATSATWELAVTEAGAVTVDPEQGDIFYYNAKQRRFHRFKPHGTHEVENARGEVGKEAEFQGGPGEVEAARAAFEPSSTLPGHPGGVLYVDVPFESNKKVPAHAFIFAPPPHFPPSVDAETVSAVGETYATVEAQINPQGFDTAYEVQYGSEGPCSTSACAEAGGGDLGEATSDRSVTVTIGGLKPDSTYYYRVVANNAFGSAEGEGSFRTFPVMPSSLPDGRAYELVSPADKHGGEVFPLDPKIGSCSECEPGRSNVRMPAQSAPDGESIVYEGFPFQAEGGAVSENEYWSVRTPFGWQTHDRSPPLQASHETGYVAFSADLSRGVLDQHRPLLAPDALVGDLYLREGDSSLQPLLTAANVDSESLENPLVAKFAGASGDFGRVSFEANDPLTGADPPNAPAAPRVEPNESDLYEWDGGRLRLVNVLPGNEEARAGAVLGAGLELRSTTESAPDHSGAVSADGSRIFWSEEATGQVYVRENGERTVAVPDPGKFLTASADGARVLLDDGHLYDLGTEAIADLTAGEGGFQGILGASEDLGRVYFVDTLALTAEEGPEGGRGGVVPEAGKDNVYLYDADAKSLRFIATLAPADNNTGVNGITGDWQASPSDRFAQVTPDGRYLAFRSVVPLTGYDNHLASGVCGESNSTACFEVFEFDADANAGAGRLMCASCSPTGQRPAGESSLSLMQPVGSHFPQPRNLTSDGRVFFNSFDVLSPGDEAAGLENVYEYEHAAQGSCDREAGCIFLLSSGRGAFDSSFFSADENGKNVFLTTRERLLPEEDNDELVDLYDAREGGGFKREASPAECSGEGCAPQAPFPASPPPASTTIRGAGNLLSPSPSPPRRTKRCPKGRALKRGKCIKKCHKGKALKRGRCVKPKHTRSGR
jgi:hypothetical protein